MKAKVLFIAWHPLEAENGKNAPILAVDFVAISFAPRGTYKFALQIWAK